MTEKPSDHGCGGRIPDVLWSWVVLPILAVGFCARYESLRAAAGHGADYGGVANRSWHLVSREPAAQAARARLIRYAWYSAAMVATAGIALVAAQTTGGQRRRVRRGVIVAVMAISAAMIVDGPHDEGRAPAASLMTRVGFHAALGGLAIGCAVLAVVRRRSAVGTWTRVMAATTWGVAGASGFALAGWRAAQLEDLVRQRRDVAHVLTGAMILVVSIGMFMLRGKQRAWWIGAAWVIVAVAVAAVAWTGVLMVVDGSDRATPAWWLRGVVVQEAR